MGRTVQALGSPNGPQGRSPLLFPIIVTEPGSMQQQPTHIPLAERMRPTRLEDFVGQEHLMAEGKLLRQLIDSGRIPSLLLWGPPGSGKTTLATILAHAMAAHFVFFSAVLSGVKEIRQIVDQAKVLQQESGTQTILFVDEIHRFNKAQQDAFLPHVESGLLVLIGATTENPSFQIIAPLLSRCQVLLLSSLPQAAIRQVLARALTDSDTGLGRDHLTIDEAALVLLAEALPQLMKIKRNVVIESATETAFFVFINFSLLL